MNTKYKKILLTGADGFIGSHLVELLIKSGYNVRAFVLYNSFNSWGWLDTATPDIRKNIDVFSGDIRDPYGVRKAMEGCDAVLHLAALIAIPYSYHSPDTYIDTNVKGTLNIMQAAKDLGVARVICTSTSEVYGTAQFAPITEAHPLQPQSPYSASKIGADMIAMSFYHAFSTPISILRPFNTYGPRQSARAVIPAVISQIAAGKKEIFLGALSPVRDFSFVTDTAKGFLQALHCDALIGQTVNIGSGYEISIGDLAALIAQIMGTKIEIKSEQMRMRPENSEVERLLACTKKAQELFGWNPQYAGAEGLRVGLAETAKWFQNPENLKLYKTDIYNI